ncbi:MAG: hypothetical protein AB1589_25105 [Cyanobacteriota bacterium]
MRTISGNSAVSNDAKSFGSEDGSGEDAIACFRRQPSVFFDSLTKTNALAFITGLETSN